MLHFYSALLYGKWLSVCVRSQRSHLRHIFAFLIILVQYKVTLISNICLNFIVAERTIDDDCGLISSANNNAICMMIFSMIFADDENECVLQGNKI